jgi:hypothetical protein
MNKQIYSYLYYSTWKVNGLIQFIVCCYMKSHEHYTLEIASIKRTMFQEIEILLSK